MQPLKFFLCLTWKLRNVTRRVSWDILENNLSKVNIALWYVCTTDKDNRIHSLSPNSLNFSLLCLSLTWFPIPNWIPDQRQGTPSDIANGHRHTAVATMFSRVTSLTFDDCTERSPSAAKCDSASFQVSLCVLPLIFLHCGSVVSSSSRLFFGTSPDAWINRNTIRTGQ